MASVSGTTNNLSSLYNTYGNSNTVTGLASGMDTETMIEQAVSGLQKKIESLQQRQTMLQWKQTEMRSMITMLNSLNDNYISYRSKTNLLSPSFFTSAMTSIATGVNADKIIATGGSSSSITINSVSKLATAASYRMDASAIFSGASDTGEAIKWEDLNLYTYSNRHVTVTLDGVTKSIRIGDLANVLGTIQDTDDLAGALQAQLDKTFGAGRVTVENKDGALKFGASEGSTLKVQCDAPSLGLGSGLANYLDISTTKVLDALGLNNRDGTYTYNGTTYTNVDGTLVDSRGKALTLEINGAEIEISATTTVANLIANINLSNAGVTASYSELTNQLTFTSKETGSGSQIEFGGVLGTAFRPDTSPDALNAASLFGDITWDEKGEATIVIEQGGNTFTLKKTDTMTDLIGKLEKLGYTGMIKYDSASRTYGLYGKDGKPMDGSLLSFYQLGSDTKITLSELVENTKDRIGSFTPGEDAELNVTVNGVETKLTRSSNTFDIDGMSVTLKDTFEEGAVTFTGTVDTEKIVSAIKSFVEDYNSIMKTVREAYATQPLEKSSSTHTKYEPLTDSEKEGLSDKAIEEYEAKAKTGMFFMDSDLSGLYSALRSIIVGNQGILSEIGISVEYDSNSRTNFLEVDEDKLTAALENNVSKVASIFAGQDGEGGIMSEVQSMVKKYASTSYGDYGILVRKSGAAESAISQRAENNAYQKEIESLETQIEKWKDKISSRIDYYSRQFSMLEQLMSTYNNQSSMLMSMMGGY